MEVKEFFEGEGAGDLAPKNIGDSSCSQQPIPFCFEGVGNEDGDCRTPHMSNIILSGFATGNIKVGLFDVTDFPQRFRG